MVKISFLSDSEIINATHEDVCNMQEYLTWVKDAIFEWLGNMSKYMLMMVFAIGLLSLISFLPKRVFVNKATSPYHIVVEKTNKDIYSSLNIDSLSIHLAEPVFEWADELEVFDKRCSKNLFMTIETVPTEQRDPQNCISSQQNISGPDSIIFFVPTDTTHFLIQEIPFVVQQINKHTLQGNLTETASSNELAMYLYSLISYLELIWADEQAAQYQKIYENYGYPEDGEIDDNARIYFQENYSKDDESLEKTISTDVSRRFQKHFYESVMEGGIRMLFDYMKSPFSSEYGSLKEEVDPFYQELLEAKNTWDLDCIVKSEKKLIEKIYNLVRKYEDVEKYYYRYSSPSDVLSHKRMLCMSKTLLMYGFFEEYWINNGAVVYSRHILNKVTLSDSKSYTVDWTKELPIIWALSKYDKWIQNKLLYESTNAIDTETILLSELLHSILNRYNGVSDYELRLLTLSTSINTDNVRWFIALWLSYNEKNMYEKSYEAYLSAERAIDQIIESKESSDKSIIKLKKKIVNLVLEAKTILEENPNN